MINRWALQINANDYDAAGSARLLPDIEVFSGGATLWLRGSSVEEHDKTLLAAMPGQRFSVLDDGQLIPAGHQVPQGYLPDGPWAPLQTWFAVELPTPGMAFHPQTRVSFTLVRTIVATDTNLLITPLKEWRKYAVQAPQSRLDSLIFAASHDQAVIQGTPLPPIRGRHFVARDGIAVPAGWTWKPAVHATVVRAVFGLEPGDLAVWFEDGRWSHVRAGDFVKASRSAARLSPQEFDDG